MNTKTTTNLRFATVLALSLLAETAAWAVESQSLSGHVPAMAARLQPVGRLPGSSRLNLAIGLPLRNQEGLTTLLDQIYDPASPQYRHYLSPEQFAAKFGPTEEDYEALAAFAKAQGLTVTATHPNRTLLDVSGTVEDIEKTFHVSMQVYQHPAEARKFHAPDVEPSLDLAIPILHINGLEDFSLPRPLVRKRPVDYKRSGKPLLGSGPGGGFMGKDFRAAYAPGVTQTGVGQSVALFEFDGYYVRDIIDYESLTGLTNVPLQNVLTGGFDGIPTSYGNSEVALDIEMVISMAPGLSQVIVYEGNGSYDILNRIATDNAAKQISSSWTLMGDATSDQIYQQYAAQGQSFFQACGDWGPPPGYLADDAYITTVGGTELSTSGPEGLWLSETVWNRGYDLRSGESIASGGGISPTYPIPNWQQGLSMSFNHGSTTRRNSPDVAMVADNIWILSDNGNSSAGLGTSASAPLWAGFTALANQLAQANGQPAVGFVNPAIYALGTGPTYNSAFHDIITGNNTTAASPTNFFAVPGYDLCTGWGTPAGSNLLYALAVPQLLHITPDADFTANGPVGGPFNDPHGLPLTQTYTLANSGGVPLDWALASSVSWLDASATGGTLAADSGATNVTLSLNAGANTLTLGTNPATVWFTNLNDGSVQTRSFILEVQPMPQTAPIIVAQSTNVAVIEGAIATYKVEVSSGSLPVSYNWIRNGIPLYDGGNIGGATTGTLTISDVSADEVGVIDVVVRNTLGVVTGYLEALTIASPPVIVAPPVGQVVLPGGNVTFSVGAIGTKPFSYQWQNNGTNLANGGNTNILTLHNVTVADAGAYSVKVSNVLGSSTNADAVLAIIPVTAGGVSLDTIYSFKDANDGANPLAPLVQATNGSFYGTAISGGTYANGTLFRITTNGALTTVHAFSDGNDGGSPRAGLIQAVDGSLYGTTSSGGANSDGTVFRMTPNGALTTLHTFSGGSDGGNPWELVQGTDGNFYGTTAHGGDSGDGTVFKILPNGALTALHGFSDSDGANPRGGLIQGSDGDLHGVTLRYGIGSPYDGSVFKINTTGTLTTLFNGTETNRFSPRDRLVQSRDGNFYGTTLDDGSNRSGTIFRVSPSGLLTTLYSFIGDNDGQWPRAALVEGKDGYFYGTTTIGGAYGDGTVFSVTPGGVLTTLVHFDGFNGANPAAPLVLASDGSFYGTTPNGGANGFGTVFRLSVPAIATRPELSITPAGANIVLSWPTNNAAAYFLQVTLEIGDPASWRSSNLPEPPVILNGNYVVTLPNSLGAPHFFRLSQ